MHMPGRSVPDQKSARIANTVDQETSDQLHGQLAAIFVTILDLSAAAWDEIEFD